MNLEETSLTEQRAQELLKENEQLFFNSGLDCLLEHRGLRPSYIHLLIGMPSGGKSTMRNTVLFDFLTRNTTKRVYLHLSEETKKSFEVELARNYDLRKNFDRVVVWSESDNFQFLDSQDTAVKVFKRNIIQSECDLVVLDNVTTSKLYGSTYQENEKFCSVLKGLTAELGLPLFVLAHTASNIKQGYEGVIDMNDIRGSKTLTNVAEVQYVLQSFQIGSSVRSTLRLCKHRGLPVERKFFLLAYDSDRMIYSKAISLTFEEFKLLYQERNKLSEKRNTKKLSQS